MTDRPPGGKDELSRTLHDLRRAAGLSTREVSKQTRISQSKLSRLERGIHVPAEDDVATLADTYQAPPDVRRRLLELAADIRNEHRPVVMARGTGRPGAFQARLIKIEQSCTHIGSFSNTILPGLLQTEAYMREVVAWRELPTDKANEFVTNRTKRQTLLNDPEHRFTLVFTEGVLGWRAGTPDDMAAQCEHIAEATRRPNVKIGIIPWGARVGRFPLHAWDLYDERAVSYGTVDATAILTEPRDVTRYIELFDVLASHAVYDDEARELLRWAAAEYRRY